MNLPPTTDKTEKKNFYLGSEKIYDQLCSNFNKCCFNKVIQDIDENLNKYSNKNNEWIFDVEYN